MDNKNKILTGVVIVLSMAIIVMGWSLMNGGGDAECPKCSVCKNVTCPECLACPEPVTYPVCRNVTFTECPEQKECPEVKCIECEVCKSCPNVTCPECPKRSGGSCSCPTCVCPAPGKPDLTVANVTFIGNLTAGENIEIIALIKNLGDSPVDYTKVEIKIDNLTNYWFIHLDANSEKNLSFNWTVTEGEHTLTVVVDPENVTTESDETNNKITTKKLIACFAPYDDMYINEDTRLCYGVYDIADSGASGVIIINASNVVLDCNGAVLNGASKSYGIYWENFDNIVIKNCNIVNYSNGIRLYYSKKNNIFSNNVSSNFAWGIFMGTSHSKLYNNNIFNNGRGIYIEFSSRNTISNNFIYNNSVGVEVYNAGRNTVINNNISLNRGGIYMHGIQRGQPFCSELLNNITKNIINDNENHGIRLIDACNNTIDSNIICRNNKSDFKITTSGYGEPYGNQGDNNTCDNPDTWDDSDNTTAGCKYSC
ncbi:exported hypothetical protein [groundwater metagenome]|uniref:Periplasmic copper-binding protein NosD beta helix domain-containing protein n=1 Tax=groundwater metagenome TaxID=717931 RepID=A0A098E710_9ZZZZ